MEFVFQSPVHVPVEELAAWHHRPGALARLTPPAEPVKVLEPPAAIAEGARAELSIRMLPGIWTRWTAEHTDVQPGTGFTDIQIQGPFQNWIHTHRFLPDPDTPGGSLLRDTIVCQTFGGALGNWLARPILNRRLRAMFAWRHARTKMDTEYLHQNPPPPPLHILVTGAGGMIGRALVPFLQQAGHRVTTLGRQATGPNARVWNPDKGYIDLAGLEPVDAVLHLAGENVASGRWTAERRRKILESRVKGTRLLAESMAAMSPRPQAMVCASGISAYRADGRIHDESSPIDTATFLGHVVQAWEAAAEPARAAGIRVAHLRLGVVLSPDGGALGKLLPLFRLGLGGPTGHGKMGFPWIAIDDVLELFHRACTDPKFAGVVNGVSPGMVTNAEFTRALGRVLHRPAVLSVPAPMLRMLFGQMAEETLLADVKARPGKLEAMGFAFRFPALEPALRHMLMKEPLFLLKP